MKGNLLDQIIKRHKSMTYSVILFSNDWNSDRALSYLNRWIYSKQVEVIAVTSNQLTAFEYWSQYKFVKVNEALHLDYDYIIACDFSDKCSMKVEMESLGFKREKIIKGRILENPCFDFDKYSRIHNVSGGVSIISQHCFGGLTYNDLDLEFKSPLINMWVQHNDFFKLVHNLKYYFKLPLEFKGIEKDKNYPLGKLGDITLYLNHYKTFEDAEIAWNKRVERVNYDNILIQVPLYTQEHVDEFRKITYRKIGFSKVPVDEKDVIYLKEFEDKYILEKTHSHFWEYVLDTSYTNRLRKFPRIYDPYKLLLGEEDYILKNNK